MVAGRERERGNEEEVVFREILSFAGGSKHPVQLIQLSHIQGLKHPPEVLTFK